MDEEKKTELHRTKSTGWRMPLIFCAIIGLVICIGAFFKPDGKPRPVVPPELEHLARNLQINLDSDDGAPWKEAIVEAGSGFAQREIKDRRLENVIYNALEAGRFDAACTAVNLQVDNEIREKSLSAIFAKSLCGCENLPWAVFALYGSKNSVNITKMQDVLRERWGECNQDKQGQ